MDNLTAILLCGGKGERLRPFTDHAPKPLVQLGGRPMLFHLVRYLRQCGVTRQVFCVGYKAEMIREFLAAEFPDTPGLVCVDSGEATMTDRLADARAQVPGRALVCYGDTLANVNVAELVRFHEQGRAAATLTTYPLQCPFGIVESDGTGCIVQFKEKPVLPYRINIGFLLLEAEVLAGVARGSDMPQFLDGLAASGRLREFRHQGSHLTVNTEKERVHAESQLVEFFSAP
jgi:NDP-sugar pyrophosphorylase family protein